MNYGKVSESVYNRTVYKTIHTIGYFDKETANSAVTGADCAVFSPFGKKDEEQSSVTSGAQAWGKDAGVALRAAQHALNHLAALGALPDKEEQEEERAAAYISLNLSIPAELREAKLRTMLEKAAQELAKLQVTVLTAEVQMIPQLTTVLVTAQAYACAPKERLLTIKGAKPEQDIVMTKWLGLEGTAVITDRKRRELQTRYPSRLLDEAASFERYLSILPEAAIAAKSGAGAMQVVREGGVFGALWELAQGSGVGLVADLKKIPVKQETIEICEFFDVNPYKLLSGGSLLLTADNGASLAAQLEEQGIAATVIGRTTQGNDRILIKEEEKRFLEPAREDELYKVLI